MKHPAHPLPLLECLLRQVIPIEEQENLTGDFREMHARVVEKRGKAAARMWYLYQVLRLFPSYLANYVYWSLTMFRNYLKTALRNFLKHKAYSAINITGLAVGLACCMLIVLFVRDELSYDLCHEKGARIFRLVDSFDEGSEQSRAYALSSAPFAPQLKAEFAEVEDAVRLFAGRRRLVSYGDKKFYEEGLFFADDSLFNIFTFPLVIGDPTTSLRDPWTIVLSESLARKYFGSEDPMEKRLSINDQDYRVTGVMRDIPAASHFQADIFASMASLEKIPGVNERYLQNWVRHEFYTYLLLQDKKQAEDLQAKLPAFIDRHAASQVKTVLGSALHSRLQPLRSIHLRSHLQAEISPNGDIKYVTIFSVIAAFILLIACFNYMNLAAARSTGRAREVGMRKVIGAGRRQIFKQFMGESVIITLASFFMALLFAVLALPLFNSLSGKSLGTADMADPILLACFAASAVLAGAASGSYPSLYVSRFQPAGVLKGTTVTGPGGIILRKGLIIFQFGISIVLIIATAVVLDQLDFLRNRKLGFDKDHVVLVPIRTHTMRTGAEAVKAELNRNPDILSSTITIGVPGGIIAGDAITLLTDDGEKNISLSMIYTDHDFVRTMGMDIVAGRDFDKSLPTDKDEAFLINEAAVRSLGLEDPLSVRFAWGEKKGRVVGVVRDFQYRSLRDEINPLVIQVWTQNTFTYAIRIRPDHTRETLSFIRSTWERLDPAHPFEYSFMDETFDGIYRNEERLGRIFSIFAFLTVFIAALGLLGLTMFLVEQKTKEIGVRKVLGASTGSLLLLLSKEFVGLVLMANLLAWPAAWLFMKKWLGGFAYRVDLNVFVFLSAGAAALAAALLTVSFQTVRAARRDPVRSLRYE